MVAAVERLLDAHPECDIDRATLTKVQGSERHGHVEFCGSRRTAATCPECRGSGKYVGLQTVEDCRACGGSGRANAQRSASNTIEGCSCDR